MQNKINERSALPSIIFYLPNVARKHTHIGGFCMADFLKVKKRSFQKTDEKFPYIKLGISFLNFERQTELNANYKQISLMR